MPTYCKYKNCTTRSNFNFKEKSNALYCFKHKKEGMVSMTNLCKIKECFMQASFNFKGKKSGLYCKSHKLDEMINVKHKKCKEKDCNIRPYFNLPGKKNGLYCDLHKKDDMVDTVSKKCINECCDIIVLNNKYDDYCFSCYVKDPKNKDKPIIRNYKTKERAVADYIKEQYPDLSWKFDKTINDGCSFKRPDIMLDLGYQVLIVEIDEDQHKSYKCNNRRLMELSLDVGHRPIIFIRFNPDSYMKGEEKIRSCFSYNKNGLCKVKYTKIWNERLSALKNQIEYWMKNKSDKTAEIIQLFYDE